MIRFRLNSGCGCFEIENDKTANKENKEIETKRLLVGTREVDVPPPHG
jgi:hypothetical protein